MSGKEPVKPEQLVLQIFAKAPAPRAQRSTAKAKDAKPRPAMTLANMRKVLEHLPRRRGASQAVSIEDIRTALRPYQPPPGVIPKSKVKMAMDDMIGSFPTDWAIQSYGLFAGAGGLAYDQGYTFLGYPRLSAMAQVPEYRLIADVMATEMTRKWIKIHSVNEDDEKQDKIEALEDEFERLRVRDHFRTLAEQDAFFGRSHLYIDTGDTDNPKELKTPIGDGQGSFTADKFEPGFLRKIKPVEPVWAYPVFYNANDPFKDDWYNPQQWWVMAKETHVSRFLTFVGREVPDLYKPSFSFGGLSLTQMAKPYVDNWLETRQSVNNLIRAFSVMVLKTDLSTMMQDNGAAMNTRAEIFNRTRDNEGLMMLDKTTEEFENVAAPLSSLDKLQAQAQEHMAAVSRIPLVKLLGITPSGLNASSDGEIRSFYDTVHAYQEKFFKKNLDTVFRLAQINLWGEVDPDLGYLFEPLWELDEKSLAEMRNIDAETDGILIDKGVVSQEEVRVRISKDPRQPYGALDPVDTPEFDEPLPENISETEKIGEDPVGGQGEGGGSAGGKTGGATGKGGKAKVSGKTSKGSAKPKE